MVRSEAGGTGRGSQWGAAGTMAPGPGGPWITSWVDGTSLEFKRWHMAEPQPRPLSGSTPGHCSGQDTWDLHPLEVEMEDSFLLTGVTLPLCQPPLPPPPRPCPLLAPHLAEQPPSFSCSHYFAAPKLAPWAALSVQGFADSPVSWGESEHGFGGSGGHLYSFVIFSNQDYWLQMAVGARDECPP